MMKELPLAEVPILPLERLLVDALDQPGARRVCASEQFAIGHLAGITRAAPRDGPNIIPYGCGPPEEKYCIMAGDGIRDFPAVKRTFLLDGYAVVYKAERGNGLIDVMGQRLYEVVEIHEISTTEELWAERIFRLNAFDGTNHTITDIEELKRLDEKPYDPQDVAEAVLRYIR